MWASNEAMVGGSGDVSMCEVGRWVLPGITVRFSPSPVVDVEAENMSLPHTCNAEGGQLGGRHSSVSCDQVLLHAMIS